MRIEMKMVKVVAAFTAAGIIVLVGLPPDAAQLVVVISTLYVATLKARPQPQRRVATMIV